MVQFEEMKYRFLGNIATADLAFKAFGKTLEELFQNSALAVTEAMVDPISLKTALNQKIKIPPTGEEKLENLLFDFLSELVYLKDAKQFIFKEYKVNISKQAEEKYFLEAELWGDRINPQKHELRHDVKAVTWYKFKITQEKDKYVSQVVLDI